MSKIYKTRKKIRKGRENKKIEEGKEGESEKRICGQRKRDFIEKEKFKEGN